MRLEGKGGEPRYVLGKRREETVAGEEGKGAEVRAEEEKGGDCGWSGREGSRGTCWEREGRRLWLERKGGKPRYVLAKSREETVAGGEGKGAQVRA